MDGTLEQRIKEYKLDDLANSISTSDVEWCKQETYTNNMFKAPCDVWFADGSYKNYLLMDQFKVRDEDTYVCTFPKSGTTWVQEVVYLIQNGFDTAKAKSGTIEERMPCVDYQDHANLEAMPSPRVLKVHWAMPVLPKEMWTSNAKLIYVVRNPKDVAVSFYHFCKNLHALMGYKGDFETSAKMFLQGTVYAGPWWNHVNHGTSNSKVLVVHYEDLINHPREQIKNVAAYLGKQLTEEQVDLVQKHCSFESMRENPCVNFSWMVDHGIINKDFKFMRAGKVGDWVNYFTPELSAAFDKMVENKCTNFDYKSKIDYGVTHEEFVKIYEAKQKAAAAEKKE